MKLPTSGTFRSPGRPRDPSVDRRILDVALRHLVVHGYTRMSIDGIALDAGVSKPTIYRRWPGKVDLAVAAFSLLQESGAPPASDSPLDDLKACLLQFRQLLLRPNGISLIGVVLAEAQHTPELLAHFRDQIAEVRRRQLETVLKRARRAGKIRRDTDIDAVVAMLIGALYAQHLEGYTIGANFVDRLVKSLCNGIGSE